MDFEKFSEIFMDHLTRFVNEQEQAREKMAADFAARTLSLEAVTKELHRRIEGHEEVIDGLTLIMQGYEPGVDYDFGAETDEQRASRVGVVTRLDELDLLLRGRNRSAPTKRNMVDADAYRVLNGDLKDVNHKDAAERIGLTYAQVYSCRLEYTMKHVHKALRDAGWKSHWSKR